MINKHVDVMYRHKGKLYSELPFKYYYVDSKENISDIIYIDIRRKIPTYLHIIFILVLFIPIVLINYFNFVNNSSTKIDKHILRVPTEMYYDYSTKVLDVDITNDNSNFETISIIIKNDSGDNIAELNGIKPGESIGSIPIDNVIDNLPMKCTVIYKSTNNLVSYKTIELNVLMINKDTADNDTNRDF